MGFRSDLVLRIDGAQPLSAAPFHALQTLCDRAEDDPAAGPVTIHVSGVPGDGWTTDLSVGLVSKWERALRRLERLIVPTVAMVSGDCGGHALDALLATDFRIATPEARLLVTVDGDATWPGMSLYRLARQAGAGRIRRAALLGVPIEMTEALSLRLVDEVVDDPDAALAALAERTGAVAGKELAIRRQLLFDASRTSFEDALGPHLAACDRALRRGAGS
ncbi:enoyl-CoA-hydratase DpgB [Plantactinospora solaniradicis]|uniref:Enoyl-CoA-hydratase DpgB n=1 Tax=Plantactinospora solaniradicis TaxID=1723736 RepID=A0ABW1KGK9_9ACTN